jgi:HTH-type transcriptional regulator/antitoxin HigA
MIELCSDAGVALALIQEINGAPVNGAAKWLTAKKALICLNLHGKFNDRFWFTFLHEAGHILNESKREVFVDSEYSDDPCEHAANSFAACFLIPARCDSQLGGLKSRTSIIEFSASIGIRPGIVVGRLQREGILPYSHLNSLKERFEWVDA